MALAQQHRMGVLHAQVHLSRRGSFAVHQCTTRPARQVQARARLMPRWSEVFGYLKQQQLKTISPEAASELIGSGDYALVDVRLPVDHEKAHPANSTSVPMYVPISNDNMDATKLLKMVAYKFNGVNPVEPNVAFFDQVRAAMQGKKGVIVFCEAGGTLVPTVNFPEGKASRSLQAAYRILNEGITSNVLHLERGAYGWFQADLPFEGEYAPELGRTPQAAAEPTLQRISQSVGYESRESDKQPAGQQQEKSNKLWPW